MDSVNANAISYICGRQWPGCHCRSSTAVNNGGQIGEGDLDVRTVVAAMEIAEREEVEIMHYEPRETVRRPQAERLPQQPQPSRSTRAQPATHARAMPPTRAAIPATTTSATTMTGRTDYGRTQYGRTVQATPRPVSSAQPRPGALPSEAAQTQRPVRPASRASAQSQLYRAVLARPRRPVRPTLSGMPVTPIRSAI